MEKPIRYIKPNVTKKWLQSHDFYYNQILSDDEDNLESYSYRFPVYKYGVYTTLECEFTITLGLDDVLVNVYDYGTRDRYAPFYCCEYGNYDKILNIIVKNIEKKAQQFKFINAKEDYK